ncbi:NAD(P)-binding domain-containing protein [Streptomyces sp. NPDC056937]|uniref:NAD(P)-binding domain-containing protein n=1 Tax=Streptomyces sp. NPDC056937 TaxID=3345969 RepID=UPI00363738B3
MTATADVVVIGGAQAGLAAGYHLRRLGLDFVVLDARSRAGGARQHAWDSLRLFSPAAYSSLPGRLLPPQTGQEHPDAAHVVDYLTDYEHRYDLPVHRPVRVNTVRRDGTWLRVETDSGAWSARAVTSATGTWWRPFLPAVPGMNAFTGRQLHTAGYRSPADFAGQRVVVVGGGDSGAQIAADLAHNTELTWVTSRPPRFLADDIDGRALFDTATTRRRALDEGGTDTGGVGGRGGRGAGAAGPGGAPAPPPPPPPPAPPPHGGGPPAGPKRAAPPAGVSRDAGLLKAQPMFTRLTSDSAEWSDGTHAQTDTVIWCTGFRPALSHLAPLALRAPRGHIPTNGTRAVGEPRLHLLGYGDWTGPASATLIGVGRPARDAAREIAALLR